MDKENGPLAILLSCTGVNITSEHQPLFQFPNNLSSKVNHRLSSYTDMMPVQRTLRGLLKLFSTD